MNKGKGKRSKSCSIMEADLDRISDLPNEVIEKILSGLPFKEGVRTSVLSRKWRYKWLMVPHLVFDDRCPDSIVDHILSTHIGPISKFQLSRRSRDIGDMDRWILPISRHPINELILEISAAQRYDMPPCMFSCQDMIHLHLSGCVLKPPSTFKGFRSLKSLHLEHLTVAQDALEHMIVSSPLLEKLTLHDCGGFRQLKIDAPNLQFLRYYGFWDDLSLVNTQNLALIGICKYSQLVLHSSSSNLLKFLVHLPKVQTLNIYGWFLNHLAGGALLEELHKPFLHLKVLDISIFFDEVDDVSSALCLLRSSPALQTLNIRAMGYQNQADVGVVNPWLYNNRSCSFNQLRHVKIHRITSVEAELEFISFLLASSPALETLTVAPGMPAAAAENQDLVVLRNSFDVVKRLLQFRRASPNLVIMYSEPMNLPIADSICFQKCDFWYNST